MSFKQLSAVLVTAIIFSFFQMHVVMGETVASKLGFNVAGQVVDALSGAPIADATVTLQAPDNTLFYCKSGVKPPDGKNCKGEDIPYAKPVKKQTDKDGRFLFENVPAKWPMISASKEHYVSQPDVANGLVSAFSPLSGRGIDSDIKDIKLKLTQTASISGIVRDDKGAVVGDSYVSLFGVKDGKAFNVDISRSTQTSFTDHLTNPDGSFQFDNLPPGEYYLIANPVTYAQSSATESPQGQYEEVYHHMSKGTSDTITTGPEGLVPSTDAKGQHVGYVSDRYPAISNNDPAPVLKLAAGENVHADLHLHLVPLYHVSGTAYKIVSGKKVPLIDPLLDTENSESISSAYPVHTKLSTNQFDVWLPSGNFTLKVNYSSPDGQFDDEISIQVDKANVSGVELSVEDKTSVEIPIIIEKTPSCEKDAECKMADVTMINFDEIKLNKKGERAQAMQQGQDEHIWTLSISPGTYSIEISTMENVYAKMVLRGDHDLNREPLIVHSYEKQEPIKIVLDKGSGLAGALLKAEKPINAFIYVIPMQQNVMELNAAYYSGGTYEIKGLAPGSYLFIASEADLKLDIHDPKLINQWRGKVKPITLEQGKTFKLDLEVMDVPTEKPHCQVASNPCMIFNGYDAQNMFQKNLDVTGTMQPAVIGQQINLNAILPELPKGLTLQNQKWHIDGPFIGGTTVTATTETTDPVVATNPSITFYWTAPSKTMPYVVTYNYMLTNGQIGAVEAKFNVDGPVK